jgi:hypothetical protein
MRHNNLLYTIICIQLAGTGNTIQRKSFGADVIIAALKSSYVTLTPSSRRFCPFCLVLFHATEVFWEVESRHLLEIITAIPIYRQKSTAIPNFPPYPNNRINLHRYPNVSLGLLPYPNLLVTNFFKKLDLFFVAVTSLSFDGAT